MKNLYEDMNVLEASRGRPINYSGVCHSIKSIYFTTEAYINSVLNDLQALRSWTESALDGVSQEYIASLSYL